MTGATRCFDAEGAPATCYQRAHPEDDAECDRRQGKQLVDLDAEQERWIQPNRAESEPGCSVQDQEPRRARPSRRLRR